MLRIKQSSHQKDGRVTSSFQSPETTKAEGWDSTSVWLKASSRHKQASCPQASCVEGPLLFSPPWGPELMAYCSLNSFWCHHSGRGAFPPRADSSSVTDPRRSGIKAGCKDQGKALRGCPAVSNAHGVLGPCHCLACYAPPLQVLCFIRTHKHTCGK